MEYPLTVTFQSDEDLKSFFLKHEDYINDLLGNSSEEISEEDAEITETNIKLLCQLEEQNKMIEEFKNKQKEMEEIINLASKRDNGQCATYIGECQEKLIESDLRDCLDEEFIVDGEKLMHKMDIRLIRRENKDIFGVEIKDKQTLTKKDLTKFISDKVSNNFKASVFISTSCCIPGILKVEDQFVIKNKNELYIYSNKKLVIQLAISLFLQNFTEDSDNTNEEMRDMILDIYNRWCEQKKYVQKMDKTLTKCLSKCNINLENGHLYLTTRTQCKAQRAPYT